MADIAAVPASIRSLSPKGAGHESHCIVKRDSAMSRTKFNDARFVVIIMVCAPKKADGVVRGTNSEISQHAHGAIDEQTRLQSPDEANIGMGIHHLFRFSQSAQYFQSETGSIVVNEKSITSCARALKDENYITTQQLAAALWPTAEPAPKAAPDWA